MSTPTATPGPKRPPYLKAGSEVTEPDSGNVFTIEQDASIQAYEFLGDDTGGPQEIRFTEPGMPPHRLDIGMNKIYHADVADIIFPFVPPFEDQKPAKVTEMPDRPRIIDPAEAAIKELDRCPTVHLTLSPIEALSVLSHLQLSLRHPANDGASSKIVRAIARKLQESMKAKPKSALAFMLESGWDESFDIDARDRRPTE